MLLETNKKHKYNQFTQIDFDGDFFTFLLLIVSYSIF